MANFNELYYSQLYENLESFLRSDLSIDFSMRSTIAFCQSHFPEKNFDALAVLDYREEIERFQHWIVSGLKNDPCKFEIASMYVGLGEFHTHNGIEFCDVYVGFMDSYDETDAGMNWLWSDRRHYPSSDDSKFTTRYFGSFILKQFGLICNSDKIISFGTACYIALCNSYLALLVHHGVTTNLGISSRTIGVAGGFDGGDLQNLGSIGPSGHNLGNLPLI